MPGVEDWAEGIERTARHIGERVGQGWRGTGRQLAALLDLEVVPTSRRCPAPVMIESCSRIYLHPDAAEEHLFAAVASVFMGGTPAEVAAAGRMLMLIFFAAEDEPETPISAVC